MTNAKKFQLVFNRYATEIWALPEKDFLEWLNKEYKEEGVGKKFICRKCGLTYYADVPSIYDKDFGFNYWLSNCPQCGYENEINNCYWR